MSLLQAKESQPSKAACNIYRKFQCHMIKQGKMRQFSRVLWRSTEDLSDFALCSLEAIHNYQTQTHCTDYSLKEGIVSDALSGTMEKTEEVKTRVSIWQRRALCSKALQMHKLLPSFWHIIKATTGVKRWRQPRKEKNRNFSKTNTQLHISFLRNQSDCLIIIFKDLSIETMSCLWWAMESNQTLPCSTKPEEPIVQHRSHLWTVKEGNKNLRSSFS